MGGIARRGSGEKEQFWRRIVAGQAGSGLSIRGYCSDRGVNEPSFFAWRKELARRDAAANKKRVRSRTPNRRPTPIEFARLQIAPGEPAGDTCIEIILPAGVCIRVPRGACPDTLGAVLGALERPRC